MSTSDSKERPSTNPSDLKKERDAVVRQFLQQGAQYTEDLLAENRSLEEQVAQLQNENSRLRTQLASDDAIRELIKKIDHLEDERRQLLEHSSALEQRRERTEARTLEMEVELSNLANLYIATGHLYSGLSVRSVVRHISELLQQLVGASSYGIYLRRTLSDPEAHQLTAARTDQTNAVIFGEGKAGEVLATGILYLGDPASTTVGEPLAAVPLCLGTDVLGVVQIFGFLTQKHTWAPVDRELLHLLQQQAAHALLAAAIFPSKTHAEVSLALQHIHAAWQRVGSLPPGHHAREPDDGE